MVMILTQMYRLRDPCRISTKQTNSKTKCVFDVFDPLFAFSFVSLPTSDVNVALMPIVQSDPVSFDGTPQKSRKVFDFRGFSGQASKLLFPKPMCVCV